MRLPVFQVYRFVWDENSVLDPILVDYFDKVLIGNEDGVKVRRLIL